MIIKSEMSPRKTQLFVLLQSYKIRSHFINHFIEEHSHSPKRKTPDNKLLLLKLLTKARKVF
jgi:hypothetical protein